MRKTILMMLTLLVAAGMSAEESISFSEAEKRVLNVKVDGAEMTVSWYADNTDRIIVTGTSGGGALSTVIAASGNCLSLI